jgi:hypothetical protein
MMKRISRAASRPPLFPIQLAPRPPARIARKAAGRKAVARGAPRIAARRAAAAQSVPAPFVELVQEAADESPADYSVVAEETFDDDDDDEGLGKKGGLSMKKVGGQIAKQARKAGKAYIKSQTGIDVGTGKGKKGTAQAGAPSPAAAAFSAIPTPLLIALPLVIGLFFFIRK